MSDSARGCLNRAAALYRDDREAHIALSGAIAERISKAREYLINADAVPAAAVLASTNSGDPDLVVVTLMSAVAAKPELPLPAPPPPTSAVPPLQTGAGAPNNGASRVGAGDTRSDVDSPPHQATPVPPTAHARAGEQPAKPAPPTAAPPKDADPYSANEKVQDWENRLKSGGIDFNKPQTMVVGKSTGIVVAIHGYLDKSQADLPGVISQGSVKLSEEMRVDLQAPLAPGEFQIMPAQGQKHPIPIDGTAKWEFQVTPLNETSDPQTLVIQPYLYPPGNVSEWPLQAQTFAVHVTVEPFWTHIRELWDDDPIKVVKYLLPGGAGFSGIGAFVTGLIALLTSLGIIARLKRKIDPADKAVKSPD